MRRMTRLQLIRVVVLPARASAADSEAVVQVALVVDLLAVVSVLPEVASAPAALAQSVKMALKPCG
jgi:hypothetical protein